MAAGAIAPQRYPIQLVDKVHTEILGVFRETQALDGEVRTQFAETQAIMLLWPYLRAYTAELTRMTTIDVPTLPTLDVLDILKAMQEPSEGMPGRPADAPHAKKARPMTSRKSS